MSLSNYLEDALMDWCFFGTDMPTAPTSVEIALHTGDPGDSGDANEIDSSSTNYARVSVPADSTNWTKSTSGDATLVTCEATVDFGTADSEWGTVTHYTIRDGSADDNALRVVDLNNSRTVNDQDRVTFEAGDVSVDID